jgi:hypothetical protein
MGFIFRAAVVIGLVYVASPLSDTAGPPLRTQAQDLVRTQAGKAADAALALCGADPGACLAQARAAGKAGEVSATAATRKIPEPPPAPRGVLPEKQRGPR